MWVTAMQSGSAMFAAATTTVASTACLIRHEVRSGPATAPQPWVGAGNWLTAFMLSVICRDKDRLDALYQVPLPLLRESGAEYDAYVFRGWRHCRRTG